MATADSRGNVYVFRLTKNRYERLQSIGTAVTSMCFSTLRKSELFVASRDGRIRCFDIDSRRLLKTLTGHKHAVNSISFHPFKALMTTSSVESLSVWDLKAWKKVRTLGAGSGVVTSTFTPDGKLLLIAFRDDTVLGWSTEDFDNTCRFDVPRRVSSLNITSLTVSKNGSHLVACGKRRQLMVWRLSDQAPLKSVELPQSVSKIHQVEFLAGGEHNASTSVVSVLADDGIVRLLDVEDAANGGCPVEHTIARRDSAILSVVYDSSAKFCACCGSDGSLLLYDLEIAREYTRRVRVARIRMGSLEEEVSSTLTTVEGSAELSKSAPRRNASSPGGGNTRGGAGAGAASASGASASGAPASAAPTSINQAANQAAPVMSRVTEEKIETTRVETKESAVDGDVMSVEGGRSAPRVEQRDAAYWLQQSMPAPIRQMPSSELLEEAFGTSHSHNATDVLRRQRSIQRQRRVPPPSDARGGGGALPAGDVGGRLSRPRLAKLLRTYGRFPSKYRLTVWRYLLELPGNTEAHSALMKMGLHPRYSDLENQWPVRDQRVLRNFRKTLSSLAHWSTVFSDLPYLPYIVFPFVMVYKSDMLSSLETVMSVLVNWCGDWFETYPHPPIPQLSAIERILEHHDSELLDDFKSRAIDSRQYAWQMMRTLFTQVLTEEEWLSLFDHFFLHSDSPNLILVAIVTYLVYYRSKILSARSSDDVLSFLRRQNPIHMDDFIKLMFELRSRTPDKLFPMSKEETSLSAGSFPIPKGQYPVFERYPKHVVDFQLQERERLAMEERTIKSKRDNLADLQRKAQELQEKDQIWRQQQEEYLRSEEEKLASDTRKENQLMKERMALNKLTEERRLRQIALQQSTISSTMEFEEKALEIEQKRREQDLSRRLQKDEMDIEERKKEEEILSLEYATMVRVRDQETRRGMDEQLKALRAEFIARDTAAALESTRETQSARLEDEYRKKTLEVQTQQAQLLSRQAELDKLRRALESKEMLASLDRDQKMESVRRERMLRKAEEHANKLASEDHAKQVQRERLLLAEEARQERMLLAQHKQWRDDQTMNRKRILDEETRRRFVESELRERRLRELEQLQRDRDLEEALLARRGDEIKDVMMEENNLRDKLTELEEERQKDRRIEMQLLSREHELHKKASVEHVMRAADARLVSDIRSTTGTKVSLFCFCLLCRRAFFLKKI